MLFRHILIKLIFLLCLNTNVTAQLNESFADGDFSLNPKWLGDTTNWKIVGLQLNSNAPSTATQAILATPSALAQNSVWEFFVDLKFATSSVNYADIYLVSDSLNLSGANSGIFVRVGNTADEISLYRKDLGVITKLIDGTDGRVSSTTNNLFKIKVTRNTSDLFELYDDASGTGNSYILEGSAIETAYPNSAWFGFLIRFSSANIQKFFFDDIRINTIVPDTTAPVLDSIWTNDSMECTLQFSEAVDTASVSILTSYLLNNSLNPLSAVRSTVPSQVVLRFGNAFANKFLNSLFVKNIKDVSGNVIVSTTKSFQYVAVQHGDILINEVFADPSPQVGLPLHEFVELYNNSGADLNLSGWTLTDGTNTGVFPSLLLPADSFVVVSTTASLNAYAAFGNSVMLPNFPSLNNDKDKIQLITDKGVIIDEVSYDLSWYGDNAKSDGGWSLEMIHPGLRCREKYNWTSSVHPSGGSPGKMNATHSPGADTVSPKITQFLLVNDSMAWVVFNSVMDSISVAQISITGNAVIKTKAVNSPNADSLLIGFTPLLNQASYSINFNTARSCNGITMLPATYAFIYDKPFPPSFNGIIISEALINPDGTTGLPNSPYLEIHNRSGASVNLQGMKITDGTSTAILPHYVLRKDSFVVVAPASKITEFVSRNIPGLFVSAFPYLNIESDRVLLSDSNGTPVHFMHYNTKLPDNPLKSKGGWSIEMADINNPCAGERNWLYSENLSGGTPGKKNSVNETIPDTLPLRFIRAYTLSPYEAVFLFNKAIDLGASGSAQTLIAFTPSIPSAFTLSYFQNHPDQLVLKLSTGTWSDDTVYHVNIRNLKSCGGVAMSPAVTQFGLPSAPKPGDIVINEMLFDARSFASEFVEIYNTSGHVFDLSLLGLRSFDKNGVLNASITASGLPLHILPGMYIALCADNADVRSQYFSTAPDHLFMNTSWRSLDDDSGLIVLHDPIAGVAIDSVPYSKNFHHPFLSNTEGVSLERVSFGRDGKDAGNWQSAASSVGYATPAYQNSKYSNVKPPDEFVYLSKKYFTPDNDGVEDELHFSIVLPAQNYSLSITLYDINGNEIKKLARNDIASIQNYYVWNGSTNEGGLANTGHYILMIEAIDGNGDRKVSKQVVDLLMK